jgi:hypothetical protein
MGSRSVNPSGKAQDSFAPFVVRLNRDIFHVVKSGPFKCFYNFLPGCVGGYANANLVLHLPETPLVVIVHVIGSYQIRRINVMPLPRSLDSPGLIKALSGMPSKVTREA